MTLEPTVRGISLWSCSVLVRCTGLSIPRDERAEWIRTWSSELWYVDQESCDPAETWRFMSGVLRDALEARASVISIAGREHTDSPFCCIGKLLVLLILAYLGSSISPLFSHIQSSVLSANTEYYWLHSWGGVSRSPLAPIDQQVVIFKLTLLFSCVTLPALTSWRLNKGTGKLTAFFFLLVKLLLIIPAVFLAIFAISSLFAAPLNLFIQIELTIAGFLLAIKWAFDDQKKRCPKCLCALRHPVRIGQPGWACLDWNLIEYICPSGHGMLYLTDESADGSSEGSWLTLNIS